MGGDERPPEEASPWAEPADGEESEPEWADQIRSGRKDRGERLREIYARFASEPTPLDDGDEPA